MKFTPWKSYAKIEKKLFDRFWENCFFFNLKFYKNEKKRQRIFTPSLKIFSTLVAELQMLTDGQTDWLTDRPTDRRTTAIFSGPKDQKK